MSRARKAKPAPKDRPKLPGDTVWQRANVGSEASAGYDLAGNIIVGLGLGWLLQRWFPGLKPWGYVGGIILGSISGFYQLFRMQDRPQSPKAGLKPDEQDHA